MTSPHPNLHKPQGSYLCLQGAPSSSTGDEASGRSHAPSEVEVTKDTQYRTGRDGGLIFIYIYNRCTQYSTMIDWGIISIDIIYIS